MRANWQTSQGARNVINRHSGKTKIDSPRPSSYWPASMGLGPTGWHTFRHTYRSWLDETGAPMKVQQELMRHASIQTTMNVYGQAMPASEREANGKVVEMVLTPAGMNA